MLSISIGALNGLDWFIVAVTLFFVLRGLWRGAISQVFGIAGVLAGYWVATHFFHPLAAQVHRSLPSLPEPRLLSVLVLFVLTWFCVALLGGFIGRLVHRGGLGLIDRLLGGTIGLCKAVVMAVIVVSLLILVLPPKSDVIGRSRLVPYIQEVTCLIIAFAPLDVREEFTIRRKAMEHYWVGRREAARLMPAERNGKRSRLEIA